MLRVLLIGCGDVALRAAALLRGRVRMTGLVRREEEVPKLRAHGIVPIVGDLDDFRTLARLPPSPYAVVHVAPPPGEGRDDPRTQRLLAALTQSGRIPQRFVYISTSGVYGDCAGARIDETRAAPCADAARAPPRRRRGPVARWAARARRGARDPARRPASTPPTACRIDRVKQGTPVLDARRRRLHQPHPRRRPRAGGDRGAVPRPRRTAPTTSTDDAELKMGDWFDAVADAFKLPRPPRVTLGGGRGADRADAAVVHERVAAARRTCA